MNGREVEFHCSRSSYILRFAISVKKKILLFYYSLRKISIRWNDLIFTCPIPAFAGNAESNIHSLLLINTLPKFPQKVYRYLFRSQSDTFFLIQDPPGRIWPQKALKIHLISRPFPSQNTFINIRGSKNVSRLPRFSELYTFCPARRQAPGKQQATAATQA